jgi:hypothetical protein
LVQMDSFTLRVPRSLRKAAEREAELSGRTLGEELRHVLQSHYKGMGLVTVAFLASKMLNYLSEALFFFEGSD